MELATINGLLTNSGDAVFVMDGERHLVFFNPACERMLGYRAAEVIASGSKCSDIIDCADEQGRSLMGCLCPSLGVFTGEAATATQRVRLTTSTGEHRWVEAHYVALRDEHKQPKYVAAFLRDLPDAQIGRQRWPRMLEDIEDEIDQLREQASEQYGLTGVVTRSPRMQPVLETIRMACACSSPVLITGEKGSGRETVARVIAANGLQKDGPFVVMDASAFPIDRLDAELFGHTRGAVAGSTEDYPGRFRAADGGTLLIKEVERLPDSTQARLLHAIQDKAVWPLGSITPAPANPRVLACSTALGQELVSRGKLREDLCYRLGALRIDLPPLRLRKEDLLLLVYQITAQLNQQSTRSVAEIPPPVWATLETYDWPGNLPELHSVIETAFAAGSGSVLEPETIRLPGTAVRYAGQSGQTIALDQALADTERRVILSALRQAGGQRSLAAKLMGISRSRLYRRMDALGIGPKNSTP